LEQESREDINKNRKRVFSIIGKGKKVILAYVSTWEWGKKRLLP